MRNTARMALLSRDSSDKIKRAVLRRSRPDRPERLLAGMRVYFWSPHPLKVEIDRTHIVGEVQLLLSPLTVIADISCHGEVEFC